jgi:hypothetical protein
LRGPGDEDSGGPGDADGEGDRGCDGGFAADFGDEEAVEGLDGDEGGFGYED